MNLKAKIFISQFYQNNHLLFFITAVIELFLALYNIMISWILQQIIDLIAGNNSFTLGTLTLITVITFLAEIIFHGIYSFTRPRFLQRAISQYKKYAFCELTKKSAGAFLKEPTSRYLSALTNDISSIETNYLENSFNLVQYMVLFCSGLFLMLWYSPVLTAIAVILSLFPMLASALAGNRLADAETLVAKENERFVGTIKDLLNGFPVVKSFRAEKEVLTIFAKNNDVLETCKRRRRTVTHILNLLANGMGIIAQLGVFLAAAFLVGRGLGVTPGVVIAFVNLMGFLIIPIQNIPPLLAGRKAAKALIFRLADAAALQQTEGGDPVRGELTQEIKINNLTSFYEPGQPVLRDLSITFEAGKSYAIVGGSGSGKSTLLNHLTGCGPIYEGTISYDGKDIRTLNPDSLYDLISTVQQSVFIFNDTIRNNITMFRDFPKEAVDLAIRRAGLYELLCQRGEDYICGENGCNLSGGERQRISIARCLLRGTPVMLIDEATAALDKQTASSVMDAILHIPEMTRIAVTHQLEESILGQFDEIFVLQNGNICEQGSFQELINQRGIFYSLYNVAQAA